MIDLWPENLLGSEFSFRVLAGLYRRLWAGTSSWAEHHRIYRAIFYWEAKHLRGERWRP